jgi:hypothetical protein
MLQASKSLAAPRFGGWVRARSRLGAHVWLDMADSSPPRGCPPTHMRFRRPMVLIVHPSLAIASRPAPGMAGLSPQYSILKSADV